MCTCASCSYTDSFADKGFAEWPRGNVAGPKRSAADYAAHVRYGQQWGRAASGEMHQPREVSASLAYYNGTRAAPERLQIPQGRWERDGGGYHAKRVWVEAPTTMAEYIAQFDKLNGLKPAPLAKRIPPLLAYARELRQQYRAERRAQRQLRRAA